ncbi:MAG: hypothetical protein VX966_04785 [Chloroflexota bacterium]|nr:hypothetical protein [Chloroflexota bacterium]
MALMEYDSLDSGYVILDLGTTGPDCWTDIITEMSLMIVSQQSTVNTIRVTLLPEDQLDNMSAVLRPPGYVPETGSIHITKALEWLKSNIQTRYIVGHNIINIQRSFLVEAIRRHRRSTEGVNRILDEVDDLSQTRFVDISSLYKGHNEGLHIYCTEDLVEYSHRCRSSSRDMSNTDIDHIFYSLNLPKVTQRYSDSRRYLDHVKLIFEKLLHRFHS